EFLQRNPPFMQRSFQKRFASIILEQIKNDEGGRMARRQFLHPTGSGMEAQLQFVEGKTAIQINDEFAIEEKIFRGQLQKCDNDVREIAREGLARFRLQINVLATAKSEAAKAIPFRFILPTGADRNFINRLCFHWR